MPIKFRCPNCRQFLGISPNKAGELTDCPACGRTVRVPNLDGTVAPVPAAKIDHRDAQLAEALSALSQIGGTIERPPVVAVSRDAPSPVVATTAAPVAIAVPVAQPLAAERVQPESQPQSAIDAVDAALFEFETAEIEPVRVRRRRPIPPELKIVVVVLAAIVVFLAGFLTGRSVERRNAGESPVAPPRSSPTANPQASDAPSRHPPVAADEPAVASTGVSGLVTYSMGAGAVRPDVGARVIAVPAARPATPPLSVAGFRAGADTAERDRALTVVRAAGGDYAITDDAGRYTLQVAAGRFEVLFLSRHVSHDETQQADPSLGGLLAAYFDQPAGLAGSVRIESDTIDFDGAPLRLDHTFTP